jgi:F-type H+-transporting ATPase subunit gamma
MDTLEALAKRIDTTQGLRSVVRTMKALSAASIAQYEGAVRSTRQYMRTIEMGLGVIVRGGAVPYRELHEGPTMAIVFGSDHSLCGAFNERIMCTAIEELRGSSRNDWLWLAVGGRAAYALEDAGQSVGLAIELPGTANGLVNTAHRLLIAIDEWRTHHKVSRVLLFHNRHREETAMAHRLQLWPLDRGWLEMLAARPWRSRTIPMFTMEPMELFAALSREHLFANIFRSGAESLASEHATRLAAMQYALHNIEDHLTEMTGDFRRKRQETITTELMDIVAGFEMLRAK